MLKNLFYLIIFTISCQPSLLAMAGVQNLLSMQNSKPDWLVDGRPIAQPGSKEEKLIKIAHADRIFYPIDYFRKWRLIKNGADVNTCNQYGRTPLHEACVKGLPPVVENFLKLKADPNLEDYVGHAPLHVCAFLNQPAMAKLLIKHGANIDQKTNRQITPLMIASKYGNKKNVKMLIKAGAKLDEKDHWGITAIQNARSEGHTEIVQMLKNAGAQG
ncbi:ankyrin repeat domain-containing protein [Candidatus Dependentiae bacterium]|nr:ankyrin repeat domain-containing protein [Candidatus Dependentiae bacterium]